MQWLRSQVARRPRHAIVLGKALFLVGSVLILGAAFARAALASVNDGRAAAGLAPLRRLAEAYPQYPTWLVPEGPLGFGVAAALVLAGMALTVLAEKAGKAPTG